MAFKFFNRARMTTATTGTGSMTLGSAVSGYQSFASAGIADGDTVHYVIEDGTAWEIGLGTYTASGTVLARTTLIESSTGSKISLTGTAQVFVDATAQALAGLLGGATGGMLNGKIVESHSGNAATFALKTVSGNDPSVTDPVWFIFRDASGAIALRSVTAALSVTVSSGSTLGFASGVAGRVWLGALDNSGAVELFVYNARSGIEVAAFPTNGALSTTAEGGAGAADSPQVAYSTSARTSKSFIPVAYADYDSGLATAGTWNASPSRIVLHGPGGRLPGDAVQVRQNYTAAAATGTTQIPIDDTIPQNTEGDQYLSQAITPTAAMNLLAVDVQASVSHSSGAIPHIVTALFQDSTANALAAVDSVNTSAFAVGQSKLSYVALAGGVSSTTFKVRAGASASGTTTFNGNVGARLLGGVMSSFIRVTEIMG